MVDGLPLFLKFFFAMEGNPGSQVWAFETMAQAIESWFLVTVLPLSHLYCMLLIVSNHPILVLLFSVT